MGKVSACRELLVGRVVIERVVIERVVVERVRLQYNEQWRLTRYMTGSILATVLKLHSTVVDDEEVPNTGEGAPEASEAPLPASFFCSRAWSK